MREKQTFWNINITRLSKRLVDADRADRKGSETRAGAIFAAIAGAQLLASSQCDIGLFDTINESYRKAGLLPE